MISPQNDAENDTTDPESSLQIALSVLAEQEDLFFTIIRATETINPTTAASSNPTNPSAFLDWMVRSLSGTRLIKHTIESDSKWQSWRLELSKIATLLPNLSPFELHSVASEMVWMGGSDWTENSGSISYPCVCLSLCVLALQQAPSPTITKRSKRWQSLVCETIRTFQIHWERASSSEEENDDSVNGQTHTNTLSSSPLIVQLWIELWCRHVVPAALKVLTSLPADASKAALKCGLIATTTQLAALCSTDCSIDDQHSDNTRSLLQILYNSLKMVLEANNSQTRKNDNQKEERADDQIEFWMYPCWKYEAEVSGKYCTKVKEEEEQWYDDDDEDDDFESHRDDTIWWATQAQQHEHVVGMNTSYDDIGLATLAYYGWEDRPHALTPSYLWKVWLPHVKSLLLSSQLSRGILGQRIGFTFLELFLKSIPPSSIIWEPLTANDTSSPSSPLPIFHLLSNRMLVLARPDIEDSKQQAHLKRQTDQTILWIKNVLYCYRPIDQVNMVQKLVQDCPHPGLQAMFLDSLRPLILKDDDKEVSGKFWKYIGSLLEILQSKYMPDGTLVEIEDLIDHLEIFIGSIAMLQLYVLVKKSLPSAHSSSGGTIKWEDQLRDCHHTIEKTLQQWDTKSSDSLPPSAFRLNLLEVSISEILRFTMENDDSTQK